MMPYMAVVKRGLSLLTWRLHVYISKQSWKKIINYARGRVEQTGDKVGGMAVILKDEDSDYVIKEPVILKQETTGSTCTLDKEELANYYVEMAQK